MLNLAIGLIAAVLMGLLLAIFSGIIAITNKATKGKVNHIITNLFTDEETN